MWFGPLLQGGAQRLATVVLVGANAAQAASSGAGAVVQTHALAGASATQAASCGTGAIGQIHALVASACSSTATSSAVSIGSGNVFAPRPGGMPAALVNHARIDNRQHGRRAANLSTARRHATP